MSIRGLYFLILLLFQAMVGAAAFEVQIRSAAADDVATARKILFKEAMNPLSVAKDRLLVANVVGSDTIVLAGFGQIRPVDENYSELASLYVLPDFRRRGVATKLISTLLERHDAACEQRMVCLLTLRPTTPLYEPHGFRVVPKQDMPRALQFEYAAGSVISALLGNDLVCMLRPNPN
jgi:ribosomal protein S18 acetylase RimI-like enzyme